MTFCKNCGEKMSGVISFSKDKHEKFCKCPKCYSETRHRKLRDDELDFGEKSKEEVKKSLHKKNK